MFNSTILDVAIGLTFVYLLLALICTTVNEWLANLWKTRGKMLELGILRMFDDQKLNGQTFSEAFQAHPLIAGLRQEPNRPPSYIAPRTFALTVMDLVTATVPGSITFTQLEEGVKAIPEGTVRTALLAAIQTADGDLAKAQTAIENWFNDSMQRVSGWYTRHQQWICFWLAVVVTLFVNADTLSIANKLWINPTLREEVVERTRSGEPELRKLMSATYPNPADPKSPKIYVPGNAALGTTERLQAQLGDLAGWKQEIKDCGSPEAFAKNIANHIPGWLLTIVAVSLGAPFWFDLLNRFMTIRGAGKSPEEAKK